MLFRGQSWIQALCFQLLPPMDIAASHWPTSVERNARPWLQEPDVAEGAVYVGKQAGQAFLKRQCPTLPQGALSVLADLATAVAYGMSRKNAVTALQREDVPVGELTRDALRHIRLLTTRLAALSGPPGSRTADDPEGVQALVKALGGLSEGHLARLAAEFAPAVLWQKFPPRKCLEVLRPVLRELLFRARKMQCEVRESQLRKLTRGSLPSGLDSWPGSQAVLRAVQHLSAHHTAEWSLDGRRGVNHILYQALNWHPPRCNFRLTVQRLFRSASVLQSTYDDGVLAAARGMVEDAADWVSVADWKDIRIELVAEAADYLTVGWPCPVCEGRLRADPNVHRQLPPYGPLCACTAMRWCWSDTPPHPLAQQRRRMQHRCRVWAVLSGLGLRPALDIFAVLDAVQQQENAFAGIQEAQRHCKDAARARWARTSQGRRADARGPTTLGAVPQERPVPASRCGLHL